MQNYPIADGAPEIDEAVSDDGSKGRETTLSVVQPATAMAVAARVPVRRGSMGSFFLFLFSQHGLP